MKKYFNVLYLFLLFSLLCYFGCRESIINQNDNCIKLPLIFSLPYGSDIDGGFFYYFTGKHITQSNTEIDNSVTSKVVLFYRNWKDSINVLLDSLQINNSYQKVMINPFYSHMTSRAKANCDCKIELDLYLDGDFADFYLCKINLNSI